MYKKKIVINLYHILPRLRNIQITNIIENYLNVLGVLYCKIVYSTLESPIVRK